MRDFYKIKDNGIDAHESATVVYRSYMRLRVHDADMPLDFILPVSVHTTVQSPPAASQMLGNLIQMSNA